MNKEQTLSAAAAGMFTIGGDLTVIPPSHNYLNLRQNTPRN
jgi:hypothetical protein